MLAAAWVTAGATVGLLIVAIFTVMFAFAAWKTQFGALLTQVADVGLRRRGQAERDLEERRQAQAVQVFTWASAEAAAGDLSPSDPGLAVRVANSSQQPVYDLEVILPGGTETIRCLMPKTQLKFPSGGSELAGGTFMVELTFRDAAGRCWHTTSQGGLTELGERERLAKTPLKGLAKALQQARQAQQTTNARSRSWRHLRRQ